MKTNEAPEKIYVHEASAPELTEKLPYHIEYTRTDAFIEKACRGIEKLLSGYIIRNFNFGDSYDVDRLIDDFKNYMEGK